MLLHDVDRATPTKHASNSKLANQVGLASLY
jgi:hypothetical protein